MSDMTPDFRRELLKLGVVAYHEQETLWSIAKRCAKTSGIPLGGAGAVMGAQAGTVAVPGVGTMSGALAGFLGGLAAGTTACVAVNLSYRKEMRKLLE